MYSAVFSLSQPIQTLLNQLLTSVRSQVDINEGLLELDGEIEMLKLVFTQF
jgi:hypothetical protein